MCRQWLCSNIAKHLLFRIPFLVPVLRENSFGPLGPLLYDVYFKYYDRYAAAKRGIPHARLKVDEMLALEPGLEGDSIGGVTTDEFGIDTARLVSLNALDAEAAWAGHPPTPRFKVSYAIPAATSAVSR